MKLLLTTRAERLAMALVFSTLAVATLLLWIWRSL